MTLGSKTAIVTGAGSGLGLAYARELAHQGASVVINDVDGEAAASAAEAIRAAGGQAVTCVAPVGSAETAERLVATAVEEFGRLDVVVTNAGILRDRSLAKMTDEDFDAVIDVHLRGTFTVVRSAYRHFKSHGVQGRIVCVGSPTGQRGTFGQTNYAAAKAGIVGMVRTWALEMQRSGVRVNAIVPVAATAMTKTVPYFQKAVEADEQGEPMPDFFRQTLGFGTAQDVAGLVAFLASDEAAAITGQVIGVGGDQLQVWSHPEVMAHKLHAGGWDFDSLRSEGRQLIESHLQTVGEQMPELPAELRPESV